MYDKKNDIYVEDFLQDIHEEGLPMEKVPGINTPQLNDNISIEN